MESRSLNGITTFAPESRKELIQKAMQEKKILVAINAEKILNAPKELVNIINSNIGYPDGVGAVWALQKKGLTNTIKIPGVELWLDIVTQYHQEKSFCLIGGTEEVLQQTVSILKREFPEINIVHARNGYFDSEEEQNNLKHIIVERKPDVVFVAMGSPKQELFMQELHALHPAVYQGLGGSFDVYVGNVERAPKWWIKHNLEWAYRLLKQPTRIKRQVKLIRFFLYLKFSTK